MTHKEQLSQIKADPAKALDLLLMVREKLLEWRTLGKPDLYTMMVLSEQIDLFLGLEGDEA